MAEKMNKALVVGKVKSVRSVLAALVEVTAFQLTFRE